MLLGCLKAGLGLLFGGSLAALLAAFPQPLLGALLTVAGLELAASIRHTRTPRGYTFALLTAAAILSLDNTGTGFVLGLLAALVLAAYEAALRAAALCWVAPAGGSQWRVWLGARQR
ncbi:hypothetical protein GPECTOR_16g716 [Gonium pectorale]|uniref:Uncharacterized protein n=1 Tax=Gonium pectorale TaxID=33097 RepID=A0A150GL74_GONPE|nr:hypothetical protein GPECTOR_16g716 [Gonium pectorale]|eukprot:KXZ50541.1 hypothetical protein GPECTOR_16g716 [Gonium pectorale]